MMQNEQETRAEAYRIAADFFAQPPDEDVLDAIRGDFRMKSTESSGEIAEEFERLFSGPDAVLPPVESLFLRAIGEEPRTDAAAFYEDAGLTFGEEIDLVPDHLAVEFLFMSYLCQTAKTKLQERFLKTHLLTWVPLYCDELEEETSTVYFREVAGILREFMEMEEEEFSEPG